MVDALPMEARLEAHNVTNSSSLLNLMMGTGRPSSGLTPASQAGGPRQLDISLRFRF
ncbi:MAG: hypothetical protein ABJF23_11785 [Bryobacteraceae bacterium]